MFKTIWIGNESYQEYFDEFNPAMIMLYKTIDKKRLKDSVPIGMLRLIANRSVFEIEKFAVKFQYRNKKLARYMMDWAICYVIERSGTEIIVYPNPHNDWGDPNISIIELYDRYEHLGFQFTEKNVNKNIPNNKMVRYV